MRKKVLVVSYEGGGLRWLSHCFWLSGGDVQIREDFDGGCSDALKNALRYLITACNGETLLDTIDK